jgi:hypothetical protein
LLVEWRLMVVFLFVACGVFLDKCDKNETGVVYWYYLLLCWRQEIAMHG